MLRSLQKFARGESYWKVILTSGREVSEVQTVTYNGKNKRPILWLEDIIASGDAARIAELWICTPGVTRRYVSLSRTAPTRSSRGGSRCDDRSPRPTSTGAGMWSQHG